MVDAPVGRTSAHAVAGTSTFIIGGEAADVERALPFLRCLGASFTHCGPLGSGAAKKLVNNYISAVTNPATAEGLMLGLAAKDLGLALQAGGAAKVPLSTGAAARQVSAIAHNHGREDWTTGIFRTLRGLQA